MHVQTQVLIATSEDVRQSVLAAGGAAALGKALLAMQKAGATLHADGRLTTALTLAALVRDESLRS